MNAAEDQREFNRRWRPVLLSYFMRRVHNHAEAEDLTQEVFTRLLLHQDVNMASPEAYIFRMASNLLADRSRHLKVRTRYQDSLLDGDPQSDLIDPYRILAAQLDLATLVAGIKALPARTQEIFILYRLENIGQVAIAETFGISVSAVKKHVARAMVALMRDVGAEP